jgi:hypothetical protein
MSRGRLVNCGLLAMVAVSAEHGVQNGQWMHLVFYHAKSQKIRKKKYLDFNNQHPVALRLY